MSEVITLLTSVSGHSLVKSFSGTDLTPQPFSTGKLFNVSEEPVSDLKAVINFALSEYALDIRNPFVGVYHDRSAGVLVRKPIPIIDIRNVQSIETLLPLGQGLFFVC